MVNQLSCPLCGRYVSLNTFNPSSLPLGIYGVEIKGLGKGKGFEISDPENMLDDEDLIDLIRERIIELAPVLGLSVTEVLEDLEDSKIDEELNGEKLNGEIKDAENEIENLKETIRVLKRVKKVKRH